MAQNTSSGGNAYTNKFFNTDFMKGLMPANALFPFDLGAVMDIQRKNLEAFTEAQQIAVENLQAIAQCQTELLTQLVQDNTSLAQQIMTEGTPEEKVSRQADMVRKSYERSVSGLTELSDLVVKSNRETGEIISKRVTATLIEFKSGLEKAPTKTKAAA